MPLTGPPATLSASVASVADILTGTDNAKYVTPLGFVSASSALRNALAPRGALAFDGTINSRITSTLSSAATIGTDAFSLTFTVRVPTATASRYRGIGYIGRASTTWSSPPSMYLAIPSSSNSLYLAFHDGTTVRGFEVTNFIPTYGGKVVNICVVRSGTTATVYVNGVQAATDTHASHGANLSGATYYFGVGYILAGEEWDSTIYSASLYNLALSQADVTEIYELGGAVPERFKFGSQVAHRTHDFSTAGGWTNLASTDSISTVASQIAANADGAGVPPTSNQGKWSWATGNTRNRYVYTLNALASNRVYTITTNVFIPPGSSVGQIGFANEATWGASAAANRAAAAVAAGATTAISLTIATTLPRLSLNALTAAGSDQVADAQAVYFGSITIKAVGAVVHYDADLDGIGYQLHDQSTNKLHGLLTTTSPTWTKQATMGYVKVLSDGTTSAQALGGGTILPANCQIIRVRARSISGTPSITLGTASGGSQIVASVALSTTWKDLTIALTGGINTAANSLWLTASAANVVEVQVAYEQLPA